jgi:translation initiation factor 1
MPRRSNDTNMVWSTSDGDLRKARGAGGDRVKARVTTGPVKVRREIAGRKGKGVTTVFNLPLSDNEIRDLAAKLKKRCGVGGSAKDGVIELQGDHRDTVVAALEADGYDVVRAGG